jgi:hypothetical protein
MITLAKALIQAAAFLELSSDDAVSPDYSVQALESIGHSLHSASPEELAAIRTAFQELRAAEQAGQARADVLRFYSEFMESFGLRL